MTLDLDAAVDLDTPLYGLDGESTTLTASVPRVRYREFSAPRYREQRHPVYEEGKNEPRTA